MAREAITAVCLDAGNTLIHCDPPPHVIYADHLSRHGRPVEAAEVGIAFRAAWAEVWRAFPDTRPALARLSERGVALAVISNWDRRLPRILDDLGLTGYFATITVSSVEGVEKPDPEIFRRTLDRLGVAPHRALHVGDSPREDCEAAADAGLEAVLIDRHGLFADEPWRRVASLVELLDIVS
jgi:putative hydrolase of the HAD superfamily